MHQLTLLHATVDSFQEGTHIIDLEGRIVYTNQAYRTFLGLTLLSKAAFQTKKSQKQSITFPIIGIY